MSAPRSLAMLAGLVLGPVGADPVSPSAATIEGTVREDGAGPLAGAVVAIVGTSRRTLTDGAGRFRLTEVPAGDVTLSAAYIGYDVSRQTVRVVQGRTLTLNFALKQAANRVEEVVTTGAPPRTRDVSQSAVASPTAPMENRKSMIGDVASRLARQDFNTEEYHHFGDNGWASARRQPLSTFAIDVDAASYANVRRFLKEGRLPPKDAVRVEEMINYFRYDYPFARSEHPFSVSTELSASPWNAGNRLAMIALQSTPLVIEELPPTNLVFLIDVSGSMNSPDKLPLVKTAFRLLVDQLRPQDRVAIVVYAGAAGLVLPPTRGDDKNRMLEAIGRLEAGGSTAGGAGIQLAYKVARDHFVAEGNNRVILATDGDFNVGASSDGELIRMIEARRADGIFLTVLGFGTGNLKDSKMEQLANKGNGHYAYIDDVLEARKVMVQELGATLYTVAKDVKLQVEFNPARVKSYRLVGYENRLLADRDFNDDTKDAGEMGAGHAVTALYEIVPADGADDRDVDPLKYQTSGQRPPRIDPSADWFTVKIRYKQPDGTRSRLLERVVRRETDRPSTDFRFAAAVAEFGMLLRDSEHKGSASYHGVLSLARDARGRDEAGYRAEFLRLVETAAALAGGERELSGPMRR